MVIKQDMENNKLTSSEVAELFSSYMSNSASACVLSYFAEKVQDPDARVAIKLALHLSKKAVNQIKDIFQVSNHPLPKGFSDSDVNINAKKLYSDTFMLLFVRFMSRFGLTNYSESRASCSSPNVREFINSMIHANIELFNLVDDIILSKGLYPKPPYIPIPQTIELAKKEGFLHGLFAEKRPLNASEIERLYLNFQRNSIGKALAMGLSQTTSNKDIQEFLVRGSAISENHMEVISSLLKQDNLPIPTILDAEVMDSTEPVFSDKLMVFFIIALDAIGLSMNGITLSRVMRHDLTLAITRFIAEIAQYSKKGMDIMIDNEWLEKIPEACNREELVGV